MEITISIRQTKQTSKGPNINDGITSDPIRFVDENGEMMGIIPLDDALIKARKAGLDLVEISPNAEPPVCKLLDYGKFRYESQKKQKDARKHQKIIHIKEIKLRVNVGEHDYQVKMKNARRFVESNDKVKVSLRFRGREISHKDLGDNLLHRFAEDLQDIAKMEVPPKMEGRQLVLILAPL